MLLCYYFILLFVIITNCSKTSLTILIALKYSLKIFVASDSFIRHQLVVEGIAKIFAANVEKRLKYSRLTYNESHQ